MPWLGLAGTTATVALVAVFVTGAPLLLLAIPVTVIWALVILATTPRAIVLHSDGLEMQRWIGSDRRMRFDECRTLYMSYEVSTSLAGTGVYNFRVRMIGKTGLEVLVPGAVNSEKPFLSIERECVRPVCRQALEAFESNERLSFGPIEVEHRSLTVRGRAIPWDQLAKVEVSPRHMWFHSHSGIMSRSVAFEKVPFPFVLIRVLQRAGAKIEYIEGFAAPR